jgi:hypothetical protein
MAIGSGLSAINSFPAIAFQNFVQEIITTKSTNLTKTKEKSPAGSCGF